MSNIKEHLIMRATEALEELNITQDIIEELGDYFEGNINEEEYLNKLPKINIDSMNGNLLEKTRHGVTSMEKYNYKDYFKKYFEILYKIGREGISEVFSLDHYNNQEKLKKLIDCGIDEAKLIGIYLNEIVYNHWRFNYSSLRFLHELCMEKNEITKNVIKNLYDSAQEDYIYGNAGRMLSSIYCYYNFDKEQELCKKYIEYIESSRMDTIKKTFKNNITESQLNIIEELITNQEEYSETDNKELVNSLKTYDYDNYLFKFTVAVSCLNRKYSKKLDKLVRLFMDIDYRSTIKVIIDMFPHNIGHYTILDKLLHIPSKYYIAFKADGSFDDFMKSKCEEDKEAFKEAIELCDEERQNKIMVYLFEDKEEKDIYIKRVEDNCKKYIEEILSKYNADVDLISEVKLFLDGSEVFEEIKNKLHYLRATDVNYYNMQNMFNNAMKSLLKLKENVIYEKVIAMLFALNEGEFIGKISNMSSYIEKNKRTDVFLKNYNIADKYKISIKDQMTALDSLVTGYYYENTYKSAVEAVILHLIKTHKEDVINNIKNVSPTGRCLYLSHIYLEENIENAEVIINNFSDTSKIVKEHIVEIFKDSIKYLDKVILKLNAKKQGEREVAIKVLEKWLKNENIKKEEKDEIIENLNNLLKTEKSQKIRDLLMNVLNIEESQEVEKEISDEEFIKNLLKGNKKSSLKWLNFEILPKVKFKESKEECSTEYLQSIIICYSSLNGIGRSIDGERLAGKLDEFDLENLVNAVFDIWIENKAEAKKKYVLSLASRFGGEKIILKLKNSINEWAKKSRGALACDAVYALALNGSDNALLIVDGISRKFKYNSVKTAAGEALDFAAKELGIEREELSDRIVSSLGFDKNGQRVFDYGTRKFNVSLTPSLEIEIYDENNKKIKTLPKPGKKDDEEKSKIAHDEFKVFKKQLKNTIDIQGTRLDLALSNNRKWSVNSWMKLFVDNPIMHQFAIGLVWAVYEDENIKETFRYMEDGTFNTKDEEEFTLLEDGNSKEKYKIGLVHPLECTKEDLEAWRQQLEDYEIVQPIEQINRKVFVVSKDEEEMKENECFGGKIINGLSLSGKLIKAGWSRGDIYDGGWYSEFYKFNKSLNIYAEVNFEGLPIGYENENTTMHTIKFYKVEDEKTILNLYGKDKEKCLIKMKDVPKKFYSEIMYTVDAALASSTEIKENWKEDL